MSLIPQILAALSGQPKSAGQIAFDISSSPAMVEAALLQLQRGRYIAPAEPGSDHCGPGCNSCSMTNLCGNSHVETPAAELWRLTPKGEQHGSKGGPASPSSSSPRRPGYSPLPVSF